MESDFGFHWLLLLLLVPLVIRVKWDSAMIKAGYEVQHTQHTIITAGMYAVVSPLIWGFGPAQYIFQPFVFGGCIFAFFFDYILNLARHLKLVYMDQGLDGKSSNWDAFFNQLPWWAVLFVKIWILLFGFATYFFGSYIW